MHGDRNLLVGVIALRMTFVEKERMIAAMQEWFQEKTKPLVQILLDRGDLNPETRSVLDKLVDHHLSLHGGDVDESINSLSASASGLEVFGFGASAPTNNGTSNGTHVDESTRFRVLRPHAKGGLGEVFVAEDRQLHREVALKEIQARHAASAESRDRFVIEAEITGGLEHPGVVPVYGVGAHPDGRPFYAMRLIKGESMKDAIKHLHESPHLSANARLLELRKLLGRFVAVCQAIAYAHSRGVVHRDIKPSNIMLGKFGETLVVDWGLAKAVGRDRGVGPEVTLAADPTLRPGTGSSNMTRVGQVLGTPDYMSPEQADGRVDAIGPASDIFSLGATLQTILTGKTRSQGVVDEVMEHVKSAGRTETRPAAFAVPPALDAIRAKAMADSPRNRYATPLDMAADIDNYLADEPVQAWSEPWSVRLWRWMRRNRTAVTAAMVLLATAAVGLGVSTVLVAREEANTRKQMVRVQEEQARAEENLGLARNMTIQFMQLERALPRDAKNMAIFRDFLERALSTYKGVLAEKPSDPIRREITAWLYHHSANGNRVLRQFPVGDASYRDAIRLLESLVADFPDELKYKDQLAGALWDQAKLFTSTGKLSDSETALKHSVDIARELRRVDPGNPAFQRTLALSLHDLGLIDYRTSNFELYVARNHEAADLLKEILKSDSPPHPRDISFLGSALNNQADGLRELNRLDDAVPRHAEAIEWLKKELQTTDADDAHNVYARALTNFGRTRAKRGEEDTKAKVLFSESIREWELLLKRQPNNGTYRDFHAVALTERGKLGTAMKSWDEADGDLQKAREVLEELTRKSPNIANFEADLGRAYLALGRLATARGDIGKSREFLDAAGKRLDAAIKIAPDNALLKRTREEVQAVINASGLE